METALIRARRKSGMTMAAIAERLGTHPNNYYRVERGEQAPKRKLARKIFELYRGEVSLSECYDPVYAGRIARARR